MNSHDRDLVMQRPVSRRDFLNGVGVALTSSLLGPTWLGAWGLAGDLETQAPDAAAGYYPPALTGMRGSHLVLSKSATACATRRNGARPQPTPVNRTISSWSGGGISGLACAHFFRAAAGPAAKILALDNHDDFGGGRLRLLNGGTLNIEGPGQYSPQSMGLLRDIGIDIERFEKETLK